MDTFTIDLPESLRGFVETRTRERGYRSPGDYLADLIRADEQKQAQSRVDALLLEGLRGGGSAPLDDQEWQDIRREVQERLARPEQPS